jgi:NAD(P)-dependent dehydrogenase (short-subunit alcohol dehydrogenase family)
VTSKAKSLAGRTALITGASRGLGVALVRGYAEAGANVVFCARGDTEQLAELILAAGGKALSVRADVSDPAAVSRLIAAAESRFERIDILVNNVGIAGPTAPLGTITLEAWEETMRSNVTSFFLLSQAVLPHMRSSGNGVILNIGSVTGKRPLKHRLPYATSKTALIGLTRTLAEELGPDGIRVNLISPDAIVGDRVAEIIRAQSEASGVSEADILSQVERRSPLGVLIEPDDVVDLAIFLSSDASRKITGQDINISAGSVMY